MPDLGLIRGLITILTLSAFLGICWWAYRPANRSRFEQDGWMAFDDHERDQLVKVEEVQTREDHR